MVQFCCLGTMSKYPNISAGYGHWADSFSLCQASRDTSLEYPQHIILITLKFHLVTMFFGLFVTTLDTCCKIWTHFGDLTHNILITIIFCLDCLSMQLTLIRFFIWTLLSIWDCRYGINRSFFKPTMICPIFRSRSFLLILRTWKRRTSKFSSVVIGQF